MKNLNFRIFVLALAVVCGAQCLIAQAKPDKTNAEFQAFLAKLDVAQLELQGGKAEAFKSIWSHEGDITLSGGFGGTIEKGWEAISKRLDWAGQQFSNGTNKIERIVSVSSGNFGYVVQLEHIRFNVPGQTTESTKDYRVTMIFRKEKGSWRIVHRQADSNMTKQPPK